MSNKTSNTQREVENELFKEHDKILDRAHSLMQFTFVIFGFYPLIFSTIYNKDENIIKSIFDKAPDQSTAKLALSICLISIIIAFVLLLIISLTHKSKLTRRDNLIQFREIEKLEKYNEEMHTLIQSQLFKYNISTFFIYGSLAFFYSYFVPQFFWPVCACYIVIGVIILRFVYLSMRLAYLRKKLSTGAVFDHYPQH